MLCMMLPNVLSDNNSKLFPPNLTGKTKYCHTHDLNAGGAFSMTVLPALLPAPTISKECRKGPLFY